MTAQEPASPRLPPFRALTAWITGGELRNHSRRGPGGRTIAHAGLPWTRHIWYQWTHLEVGSIILGAGRPGTSGRPEDGK